MSAITPDTHNRLNALNAWLADVFGEGTRLSTLLQQAGVSDDDISAIKAQHLDQFLAAVVDFIAGMSEGLDGARRTEIMLRRYGLVSGQPKTLQNVGESFGVTRERIRQIVKKRLVYMRNKRRREAIVQAVVTIAHKILAESRAE